ncbi:24517_t:CDS:2, partial [Cetraspora pellucida]
LNDIDEKFLKKYFYSTMQSLGANKADKHKYEFPKEEFIKNESINENERQYLLNMLLKDYFYDTIQSMNTSIYGSNQQRYAFLKTGFINYKNLNDNERQCLLQMLLRFYFYDTAWSMSSSIYRTNQQKYEFFKTQFFNNDKLEEHERQYLFNMLQKRFDNLSVIYKDGEKRQCKDCKSETRAMLYCEFCIRNYLKLQQNYVEWTNNDKIDDEIKKAQERAIGPNLIIEYIPNEKLKVNPNYIAKGSYAEIYKAVWTDGPFDTWNGNEKVLERISNHNVILKKLKKSNKSTSNWLNEIISHFTIDKIATNVVRCFGLTKDKDSGEFSLVLDVMDFNLQEFLIKNNSTIGWKERYQIAYKISHCLSAIHNTKSVHRDLHPGNILFYEHLIRISDLGFCEIAYGTPLEYAELMKQCWDAVQKNDQNPAQFLENYPENFIKAQIHFPESGEGPGNFIRAEAQIPEVLSSGEGPGNFIKAEIQIPEVLSSGEGPGNFIRAEIQIPEVLSSGEGQGNFLKSRIYSFQNLTEPSNFIKEHEFGNIEKLLDTDSNDFGFEKVNNIMDSSESLRCHDTDEYIAISKEYQEKDSSKQCVIENFSSTQADKARNMTRIADLLFLVFSKLHNEGFSEMDVNKNIEKYITINRQTPINTFVWLLNSKTNSKHICLLGRFFHGGIGTSINREIAFRTFLN